MAIEGHPRPPRGNTAKELSGACARRRVSGEHVTVVHLLTLGERRGVPFDVAVGGVVNGYGRAAAGSAQRDLGAVQLGAIAQLIVQSLKVMGKGRSLQESCVIQLRIRAELHIQTQVGAAGRIVHAELTFVDLGAGLISQYDLQRRLSDAAIETKNFQRDAMVRSGHGQLQDFGGISPIDGCKALVDGRDLFG